MLLVGGRPLREVRAVRESMVLTEALATPRNRACSACERFIIQCCVLNGLIKVLG